MTKRNIIQNCFRESEFSGMDMVRILKITARRKYNQVGDGGVGSFKFAARLPYGLGAHIR